MSEELKPCPACGGINIDVLVCTINGDDTTTPYCHVMCDTCYTSGPIAATRDGAIAKWNAMPRVPHWSKETPKEPGWYWHFQPPHFGMVIEFFDPDENTSTTGQWAGPIPEPEE